MRADGAIEVIEAGYRLEGDEETWLRGVAEAVQAAQEVEAPVVAAVALSTTEGVSFRTRLALDEGDYLEGVKRIEAFSPPDAWARVHRTTVCMSASEAMKQWGISTDVLDSVYSANLAHYGVADVVNIHGAGTTGQTVCLAVPRSAHTSLHPRVRSTWLRVAAHLSAGLRLRSAAARALDDADALFDEDLQCVHAQRAAADNDMVALLRHAAVAVDRARGELRGDAPAAVDLWLGLFAGAWSLIEQFDSDGRRYLVAHKNEPAIADDRALTRRERQVATLASTGCNDELIAYTLGISTSTVRTHLTRALHKLGAKGRAELVELALMLEPPPNSRG